MTIVRHAQSQLEKQEQDKEAQFRDLLQVFNRQSGITLFCWVESSCGEISSERGEGKKRRIISYRKSCLEHCTDAVAELEKSLEHLKESKSDEVGALHTQLESTKQSYENTIKSLEVGLGFIASQ